MYGLRAFKRDGPGNVASVPAATGGATERLSRRAVLKRLGLAAAGLAFGCTPFRIVLRVYPSDFDDDGALVDRVMRAFVTTVVPGAPVDSPNLTRVFADEWFPFASYRSFFASDLCRRSLERHGTSRFETLSPAQRTQVVHSGLSADSTTRKLYNGAIFLAQLSCYAGIYDDDAGCALISFEGRFRVVPLEDQTYPNPEDFLPRERTADGNYA
jgi:hypothetical protein